MRVLFYSFVIAMLGLTDRADASKIDYEKLYYFEYAYTPGPLTIFKYDKWSEDGTTYEPAYSVGDPTSASPPSSPWLFFGFFLFDITHPELTNSTLSFNMYSSYEGTSNFPKDERHLIETYQHPLWFNSPWASGDWNDPEIFSGAITFDQNLDITSWNVFVWVTGPDAFIARSDPLQFDEWEVARFPELAGHQFYTSTWHEPNDESFATSKGHWVKTTSVYCWGPGIDDDGICPEEPSRPAPIPLPASLPLLAGSLVLLVGARRLRRATGT